MVSSLPIDRLGPRIVIAGTHSGAGKTTVATGLMRALVAAGHRVASAKVGPDFIDPSYHAVATGRAGRSLDVFLSGESVVRAQAARATRGADVLVIEGVMGLFDGSSETGIDGSTAAISRLLDAPVVLVVDASAMSGSVAALVHGFSRFDPALRLAGVVLNRVAGEGHATLLREALAPLGVPVLGVVVRDTDLEWRERHLGLVPVVEDPSGTRASVERLGRTIAASLDLDAIVRVARSAPVRDVAPVPTAREVGRARVAVCMGKAFSFIYPENLEALSDAGAEIIPIDPLVDEQLPPECTGLYAGGGFPEVYASELAGNGPLLGDVRRRVRSGLATWAECGGYLWLCDSIDGVPMAGVLEGVNASMTDRLTLGYRRARTVGEGLFGPDGTELRGHEFHRSVVTPTGDGLEMTGRFFSGRAGVNSSRMFASYLHQHLAATPQLAENFVTAALSQTMS
ncbi:MAG: cobyrinate a,c-diamide synthase [Acidobacteriota bacterium]|nr:cobyrinate a,c-diamide synthase [Acidobacteriota bacterium]MDE3082375.1 cobyrinate a,c-diamide synthase [Acidobacteriota bacterium]